jgi:hypothetical protein
LEEPQLPCSSAATDAPDLQTGHFDEREGPQPCHVQPFFRPESHHVEREIVVDVLAPGHLNAFPGISVEKAPTKAVPGQAS